MQEDHLKSRNLKIPSWRQTLRILETRTPKRLHGWKKHALKIVIPPEYVEPLTTNVDNNIWDIHDRTSCEIELYKGMEGDGRSALLLSGDDVVVNDAANIIMGVCGGDALVFSPDPSNPDASLLREDPELAKELCVSSKITDQPRHLRKSSRKPYIWNHRVEDIPKPETWDQHSFMKYIRTLALVKLRPHRAIEFYGTPQAVDEVLMVLIHEAFRDKSARHAITVAAYKVALESIEERGLAFRPHARRLFTQMQIQAMPMDTDVFAKFLYGSAKARHVKSFNTMLDFMASYNCAPNYKTWRYFLQMVPDEVAKREIVRSMDSIGLLSNPHSVSDIVRELVGFDMYRAVKAGQSATDFCREMDEAYGPTWPSVTALNRMLNVCGHFGRYDMCFELLDHFEKAYNRWPEMTTYATLLNSLRVNSQFPRAVALLQRRESQPWEKRSFHFVSEMFSIAWSCRLPNVMAVLWAYACLEESTSFAMRFKVSRQLDDPGYHMSPEFRKAMVMKLYRYFAMPGYVPREIESAFAMEIERFPEQEEDKGAVIAKLIRTVWHGFSPILPLSVMIEKAWILDKKLLALRRDYADRPGSHVLSIADSEKERFLEIPIQGGKDNRMRKVMTIPLTTNAVFHNYPREWFDEPKNFPDVEISPSHCLILPPSTNPTPKKPRTWVTRYKDRLAEWQSEIKHEWEDDESSEDRAKPSETESSGDSVKPSETGD